MLEDSKPPDQSPAQWDSLGSGPPLSSWELIPDTGNKVSASHWARGVGQQLSGASSGTWPPAFTWSCWGIGAPGPFGKPSSAAALAQRIPSETSCWTTDEHLKLPSTGLPRSECLLQYFSQAVPLSYQLPPESL